MFRFVASFARVRIEESSWNRFALNGIQSDSSGGFFPVGFYPDTDVDTSKIIKIIPRRTAIEWRLHTIWWVVVLPIRGQQFSCYTETNFGTKTSHCNPSKLNRLHVYFEKDSSLSIFRPTVWTCVLRCKMYSIAGFSSACVKPETKMIN